MSVVARRFTASPVRTSSETWETIIGIIAADDTAAKNELAALTGIVATIIADETPARNPITLIGNGSRLRIYCLYGEDALGDESSEAKLSWNPFSKTDWEIHFPVEKEDLAWVTKEFSRKGNRFKTYKAGEKPVLQDDPDDKNTELSINLDKI